jgi:hypothetical protein
MPGFNDQGPFVRATRPALGWLGFAFIALCVLFILAVMGVVLYALFRWADGGSLDLQGFAMVLTSATAAGTAVWSILKNYLTTRYGQRIEEIRAGIAPPPVPTIPSPSSPDGGGQFEGVNPHGGPGAP